MLVLALWCVSPALSATPTPLEAREAAAAAMYPQVLVQVSAGVATLDQVWTWSRRWYEAQRDRKDPRAAQAHQDRMKALADKVTQRVSAGLEPGSDRTAMDWYLADAAVLASAP
jgi:hypothetical protein